MAKYDYNMIAIGGGSAGLVTSYIAAAVNAKVALIETDKMGGDCLNTGCVPSKALIRSAKFVSEAKKSEKLGVKTSKVEVDFPNVMGRVHNVIKKIEPHDSVERFTGLGVDCITGYAKITGKHSVEVNGKTITARAIVVATGAMPLVPPIPGLDTIDYLTSDNLWEVTELPKRLVVLGGGPIGSEMAQAFARLGSEVTIVEMADQLLTREDNEVIDLVTDTFKGDGIKVLTGHKASKFEKRGDEQVLFAEHNGQMVEIVADKILVALGRRPRTQGFGLEELGVELNKNGTIKVNDYLQSNVKSIYACGDVAGPYQFTHTAAHQAWYAAVNGLQPFKKFKVDYRVIPWVTFTDPEVARVGLNEKDAKEQNIAVEVTTYGIDDLDRAIADGTDYGFVKVLTPPGKDTILGVTIVGNHAGDLLAEFVLAMKYGLGLNKILGTIHSYPTMSEANKYLAGEWKKAHKPEWALKIATKVFGWLR